MIEHYIIITGKYFQASLLLDLYFLNNKCTIYSRYPLLFSADCLALFNFRVSLGDVLHHHSFNASLHGCFEEAV